MKDAIIVDIDGTLVQVGNRSYFDASKADKTDTPYIPVVDLVQRYLNDNVRVFFVTGRNSNKGQKEATERQLKNMFGLSFIEGRTELHMRKEGDFRKDTVFKGEIYKNFIKGKYKVLFALEDRKQMVDFYRNEIGIMCFEVTENNR